MITKGRCCQCGARVKVFNYGDSQRLHDKSLELCGVCRQSRAAGSRRKFLERKRVEKLILERTER